jgi:hypothetical protein
MCVYSMFQKKNTEHVLGVTMQENGSCEEECLLRFVAEQSFIVLKCRHSHTY